LDRPPFLCIFIVAQKSAHFNMRIVKTSQQIFVQKIEIVIFAKKYLYKRKNM